MKKQKKSDLSIHFDFYDERDDMAEANGKNLAALDLVLASVPKWVREHLATQIYT